MPGILLKTLPFTDPAMRTHAQNLLDIGVAGAPENGSYQHAVRNAMRSYISIALGRTIHPIGPMSLTPEEYSTALNYIARTMTAHTLLIRVQVRRGTWSAVRDARMGEIRELWETQGWPGSPEDHRLQYSTSWDWIRDGEVRGPTNYPPVPFVRLGTDNPYWGSSSGRIAPMGLTTTHMIGGY